MYTAARVFIIISMVFGAFLIYPLVLGFMALDKLKTAKDPKDLTVLAILVLIFSSLIAGILMLLLKREDLPSNN